MFHRKTCLRGVVMFAVVLLSGLTVCSALNVGDTATDFTLLGNDESFYTLYDYWGDVIVIDFSTVRCGPCQQEAPELESRIWIPYKDQGVMVFTILMENASGDPPTVDDLQDWARDFGLTFPILQGTEEVENSYVVPIYPSNFIIDQDMVIQYKHSGYTEDDMDTMVAIVEDLLGGGSPTPTPVPTSENTPQPTSTPTGTFENMTLDLTLTDSQLQPGDEFHLFAEVMNDNPYPVESDYYCVLEVVGLYFWYPGWTEMLEFERRNLGIGMTSFDVLGPFQWPDVQDSLTGLYFYSVLTAPGNFNFISNLEVIDFSYGP